MKLDPGTHSALCVIVMATVVAGCESDDSALPLVGTLARDRLELIADANEQIVEVLVGEGDEVAAGDLLVLLEGSMRAAETRVSQAVRDAAAERLAELVRGPRQERIREARARLSGAEENLVVRSNELGRVQRLLERDLSSAADLDRALNLREAAEADVEALTAALDELLMGTTKEELGQADARLSEAEAKLELSRIAEARLEIRAPRDGRVDALPYKLGERPPHGATVVVMLADQAPFARVFVPEPLRVRVEPGLAARIVVDGDERTFEGRVRYVSAEAAFTPYYSLTQRDRSRLAFLTEVTLIDPAARALPSGVPVEVDFPALQ